MASQGKRVVISGASGLLGRQLLKEFVNSGWSATGLAFSRAAGNLQKVDLRDLAAVQGLLSETRPDVVVHAAAERRPDVVEKNADATEALNVTATRQLAEECASRGIYLVYVSTDYVFDGTQPPYKPDAKPNPLNSYGKSKLAGEDVVRGTSNLRSCILRVPVLYGAVETLEESAVTVLAKNVLSGKAGSKVNHVQRRYPTHVSDVSAICRGLAQHATATGNSAQHATATGNSAQHATATATGNSDSSCDVYHWSGKEMMTKYDIAVTIAEAFGLAKDHLVADTSVDPNAVPRPHDCQLDCSAVLTLGLDAATPFNEGIKDALAPFITK